MSSRRLRSARSSANCARATDRLCRCVAVGAWRDDDVHGEPIDASGALPDGQSFEGLPDLVEILAADRKLPGCAVEKAFTYALGRGPTVEDLVFLDAIETTFVESDHRFAALVTSIVLSEPFRQRAEEAE